MENEQGIVKVKELMADAHIAMFTTVDHDGHLVSRPMAVQSVEFDGDLWFFTDEGSHKVDEIKTDPRVNITFGSGSSWVSAYGSAETVKDVAKAEEMWNPALSAWFPDGPSTPTLMMIKVHVHSAEYWDTPGSRVTTLISLAKAKITGERFSGGENETVDL